MMSHTILRELDRELEGIDHFPCHVRAPSLSSVSMIDTFLPPLSLGHTPLALDWEAISSIEATTSKLSLQKAIHTDLGAVQREQTQIHLKNSTQSQSLISLVHICFTLFSEKGLFTGNTTKSTHQHPVQCKTSISCVLQHTLSST